VIVFFSKTPVGMRSLDIKKSNIKRTGVHSVFRPYKGHSLASVNGPRSGTTSSSGNIMPNIVVCPLVYLSGRSTQSWHVRERACVGARACASIHASARALTHPQELFHTRILPSYGCASVRVQNCAHTRTTHAISHVHTQPGTVKLTPPSPDTCYGAAVMIDMMLG